MSAALCSHCLLPLGREAQMRQVGGDDHYFCCYGCCLAFQVAHGECEEADAAWLLIRLGTGAFLSMNIMLFSLLLYSGTFDHADGEVRPVVHVLLWVLSTPVLLLLGWPFLREAWAETRRGHPGSSTLISLGVWVAYGYSAFVVMSGGTQLYFDTATMVLVVFTLGRYLEAAGRAKAMRSLAPMLAPARQSVTVLEGGREEQRPAGGIVAGTLIAVRPGEMIGVDGRVVEGDSHVSEAIITGESRPIPKGPGAGVLAGSINHEGPLIIRSSGPGTASRWMQIARAVREALGRKSRAERIAERLAGAFVPAVLGLAVLTALYWAERAPPGEAMMHALAVLAVACPCALGLAAPLATSMGIGRLARCGCLVRGGDLFEDLARLRLVAFDKTGTLTLGQPRLSGIAADGMPPDEALRLAAGLERFSEHPLANGIVMAARERGLSPAIVGNVRAVPGHGISGEIDGTQVAAGSAAWIAGLGFAMPSSLAAHAKALEASGGSLIHLGRCGQVVAVLALRDPPLPEARPVVAAIHRMGIRTVLLSGDRAEAARQIAEAAGIDEVRSGLSPEAKRSFIEGQRGRVAMVGDGLNDAPVLAAADVGIAAGGATDLAREAADVVLPARGLGLLPWVIEQGRAVHRVVLTNLNWAFGYNAAALALAASGHLLPVFAAAIMAGSSLVVVLNSLRLAAFPEPYAEPALPGGASATPAGTDRLPLRADV